MADIHIVEFLDDEELEAVLEILDGSISLIAYSYPFRGIENSKKVVLSTLLASNVQIESSFMIPQKEDAKGFGYRLVGQLANLQDRRVRIGNIEIVLDADIPKDIPENSYISFDVLRLDYRLI